MVVERSGWLKICNILLRCCKLRRDPNLLFPNLLFPAALLSRYADKRVLVLERHYAAGGYTRVFYRRGYEWDVDLAGKIDYAELLTPLSTRLFMNYQQGEIYGLSGTPERLKLRCLTPHTPIRNLYLTDQDVYSRVRSGRVRRVTS